MRRTVSALCPLASHLFVSTIGSHYLGTYFHEKVAAHGRFGPLRGLALAESASCWKCPSGAFA